MAIMKEWSCAAHGFFDSEVAICPHGCSGAGFIERVIRTAPAFNSARTANIDKTLVGLAHQFGMTDMNNQNGTGAVKRGDPGANKRLEEFNDMVKARFGSPWQSVTPGGVQQPDGTIKGGNGTGGATQHIQGLGANGGSALTRDEAGQVSVPFPDTGMQMPLAKKITPDHIAGVYNADVKV